LILSPGETVGERFTVEGLLGRGGMAAVYKVRHNQLGSLHALKLLHVNRPSLTKRVLLEGRIQASMRHPNVVAVTDVVEHAGGMGLVMEYVDSASLEGWLDEHGPFVVEEALGIFAPILAGMTAAHDMGILHRDLKPANVLLARSPGGVVPKVTDFGIAKMLFDDAKGSGTIAGMPMGTPGYMAPEQITDPTKADQRADIFALGALLYALLCGSPPFQADDIDESMRRTVAGEWQRLRDRLPGVPASVEAALERALMTRPDDRFPDTRTFGMALFAEFPALLAVVPPPPSAALGGMRVDLSASGVASLRNTPSQPGAQSTLAPDLLGGTLAPASMDQPTMTVQPPSTVGQPAAAPATAAPTTLSQPSLARSTGLVAVGSIVGALVAMLVLLVAGVAGAYALGLFASAPEATVAAPEPQPEPQPEPEGAPAEAPEPAPPEATAAITSPPAPSEAPAPAKAPSSTPTKAPAGEAAPEPVAAPEPAPEPVAAAVPEPEPAPEPPKSAPSGTAEAAPPKVMGTFAGTANNRPVTVRITGQDGGKISGKIEFALGSTRRVAEVMGKVSPDGTLVLDEMGGEALHFEGRVGDGGAISGTYRKGDGKALPFSVKPQP
jgi:serine/threonine protein kinase